MGMIFVCVYDFHWAKIKYLNSEAQPINLIADSWKKGAVDLRKWYYAD